MKITKIMTDLLKAVEKKKTINYLYGMDDEYIYLFVGGHKIFKIHKELFLIDLSKALPDKSPLENPSKFFKDYNFDEAWKTDELKILDNKITAIKLVSENSHVWINEKFLKDYDSNCTFKISNIKSPVFVYENEIIVGLILPIFVKEDRNND